MSGTSNTGPGAVRTAPGTVILNAGKERRRLVIVNTGDRPVQIGSHIHLPLVNAPLTFDRAAAEGFRLDVPSGTSQRFEPGASREVDIVRLGGTATVPGIQTGGRDDG
jgi:urease beta subunit